MTVIKTHKNSLSIAQRIKKLEDRNLTIDNDKMLTDFIEKKTTYYHLTSYRFLLDNYDKSTDNYNNHKSSELIALYELDKRLSILLFKEIRLIEQSLRANIANLCHKEDMVTFELDEINEVAYLKENYCNNNKTIKFIAESKFNKIVGKKIFSDLYKMKEDPAIKHHLNDYNKVIPIWVAVNYISFGTLIGLIDCFTTKKLNEFMDGKIYVKTNSILNPSRVYLKAIQMLRNKISHHSNILGKKSPFNVKGINYSIYLIGYYGISAWASFLFDDNNKSRYLKNEINEIIKKINFIYNTEFDFFIFMCKNIK